MSGYLSFFVKEEDSDLIEGLTDRLEMSPFFVESGVFILGILVLLFFLYGMVLVVKVCC